MEPVSAFSVYAEKRKNTEQLVSNKRKKRKLQEAYKQQSEKRKNVKRLGNKNQQMEYKSILNVIVRDKGS